MKITTIEKAKQDALSFIAACDAALQEQNNAEYVLMGYGERRGEYDSPYRWEIDNNFLHTGKLAANIKRKSMDLSRSLADMRGNK
ncbi:MAG: hypothetical protein [Caudoviricetes sp.]|nr:MAG: hypothetical protein [Caudoviricetes sp.]